MRQKHDRRLIFADTDEYERIVECLEELVGAFVGPGKIPEWQLMSMSLCRVGGLPHISDEVRLRKVQSGPELGRASIAQRVSNEEVLLTVIAADAQVMTKVANASMMGGRSGIAIGKQGVPTCSRCGMDCNRSVMPSRASERLAFGPLLSLLCLLRGRACVAG